MKPKSDLRPDRKKQPRGQRKFHIQKRKTNLIHLDWFLSRGFWQNTSEGLGVCKSWRSLKSPAVLVKPKAPPLTCTTNVRFNVAMFVALVSFQIGIERKTVSRSICILLFPCDYFHGGEVRPLTWMFCHILCKCLNQNYSFLNLKINM